MALSVYGLIDVRIHVCRCFLFCVGRFVHALHVFMCLVVQTFDLVDSCFCLHLDVGYFTHIHRSRKRYTLPEPRHDLFESKA